MWRAYSAPAPASNKFYIFTKVLPCAFCGPSIRPLLMLLQPLFAPPRTQCKTFGAHLSLKTGLNRFFCCLRLPDRINLSSHPWKSRAEVSSYARASDVESLLCPCTSIKQVLHLYKSSSVCVLRTNHKATSYAVRKMISELLCGPSIRPLLMLLEKLYQKTAFLIINFSIRPLLIMLLEK